MRGNFVDCSNQAFLVDLRKRTVLPSEGDDSTFPALKHSNRKVEGGLHRTIVLRSHVIYLLNIPTYTDNFNAYTLVYFYSLNIFSRFD